MSTSTFGATSKTHTRTHTQKKMAPWKFTPFTVDLSKLQEQLRMCVKSWSWGTDKKCSTSVQKVTQIDWTTCWMCYNCHKMVLFTWFVGSVSLFESFDYWRIMMSIWYTRPTTVMTLQQENQNRLNWTGISTFYPSVITSAKSSKNKQTTKWYKCSKSVDLILYFGTF